WSFGCAAWNWYENVPFWRSPQRLQLVGCARLGSSQGRRQRGASRPTPTSREHVTSERDVGETRRCRQVNRCDACGTSRPVLEIPTPTHPKTRRTSRRAAFHRRRSACYAVRIAFSEEDR